jgi:hypothetical protein
LNYQYALKKIEGQEDKIGLVQGWVARGRHKERVNEGKYSGCILYSYVKIEQ